MSIDELVALAMTSLLEDLVAGLPPSHADWVARAFRETILPLRLHGAETETKGDQLERLQIVKEDMLQDFSDISPSEKYEKIAGDYYLALLEPLSERAFDCARSFHVADPEEQESLQAMCQPLLSELRSLRGRVEEEYPEILQKLGPEFSEALLDCRMVVDRASIWSLRLNREFPIPVSSDSNREST